MNLYYVRLKDGRDAFGHRQFIIGAKDIEHAHSQLMIFIGSSVMSDEPITHLVPLASRLPAFKFRNLTAEGFPPALKPMCLLL